MLECVPRALNNLWRGPNEFPAQTLGRRRHVKEKRQRKTENLPHAALTKQQQKIIIIQNAWKAK